MKAALKVRPCSSCGSTEFSRDHATTSGDLLCMKCGLVQEENPIVSEVQFGESASGAAMVQGAMVGSDQARAFNARNSLESREQTIMNAKHKIRTLGQAMKIPEHIHDSAHGWFKLALVQNFIQGRRSHNVIAACLYVACRHEKTHHLLIDFSSRLQISVYSLGATYLKLVRALQIQRLPLADPSLFIQHFAERLNFGEHTAKVCRDATKIALRMSSDWIHEGRRPAGIAGACLLLAARMNNFRRSHAEIVSVARVGEETLQKRLNEFKKTSSAALSILEFRESNPTNDAQPPSFQKNRQIERKIEKLLEQRRNTLERYRKLAKERRLFQMLNIEQQASDADTEADTGLAFREALAEAEKTRAASGEKDKSDDSSDEVFTDAPEEQANGSGTLNAEEGSLEENDGEKDAREPEATEEADETKLSFESAVPATNQLFVPSSDDEDFGYGDLPEQGDKDQSYKGSYSRVNPRVTRNLRESTIRESTRRLGRLGGMSEIQNAGSVTSRFGRLKTTKSLRVPTVTQRIEERRQEERTEERKQDDRDDELLKAVLTGGDIKEEDLEQALDRILRGQEKTLDGSLYRTPAEVQNEQDITRRIELDRPRNLVQNCPTTSQVLSKVRDDEEVNSDDEDDEVLTMQLTDAERLEKERVWIALNHDFLIAQEKKRLKMEADELAGNTSGQTRKRRRVREQKDPILSDSAVANAINLIGEQRTISPAESAKQMLQKKLFSRKINYESIGHLFLGPN